MSDSDEDDYVDEYQEEYNYHYIFGVRSFVNLDKDPPVELGLDFVVEYCTDDVNKVLEANEITKNEMWKTEFKDALEIIGKPDLISLVTSLHVCQIRARYCPELTVHHLKTTTKIDREFLNIWLQSCLVDKYARDKLQQSKVW